MDNLFFTNSLMIRVNHVCAENAAPSLFYGEEDAISKIHRFCHEIYNIPVTWLVDHKSMLLRQDMLKEYMNTYNDEVAILEWGMWTENNNPDYVHKFQPWVESAGIERPKEFAYNDELRSDVGFHNMSTEDIKKAMIFFIEDYKRIFGKEMKTFANAFIDGRTIKICKELGIKNIWGYNWNYFCEGINNKGCPPGPFYISENNHNVPGKDDDMIGVHWGACSHLISEETDKSCRPGGPGHCLNVMELTNRSYGLDKINFHKKVIEEYANNAKWNPIVHIPLQIETSWINEGCGEGKYEEFPTFTPSNTESYYTELETCMEVGAKGVTVNGLCDYMRENVPADHKYIFVSHDIVPDLRHKGKDDVWTNFVVYKDNNFQYWFKKDRKFNYIRKYDYVNNNNYYDSLEEFAFENEPLVTLEAKSTLSPNGGISIINGVAKYEIREFSLSSQEDYKDYASIMWFANLPDYINKEDLKKGGFVKDFIPIKEENAILLFGDLKKGINECILESDKPKDYVKVVRREIVGKRYEIWIENKGSESDLIHFEVHDMPHLCFGNYWWNGEFNHSVFRFGTFGYDYETGFLQFKIYNPNSLKLKHGLNRLSFQLY